MNLIYSIFIREGMSAAWLPRILVLESMNKIRIEKVCLISKLSSHIYDLRICWIKTFVQSKLHIVKFKILIWNRIRSFLTV